MRAFRWRCLNCGDGFEAEASTSRGPISRWIGDLAAAADLEMPVWPTADAVTRPAVSGSSHLLEPAPGRDVMRLSIAPFSRNGPQVFEAADRIRIHRLGKRPTSISPQQHPMRDAIAPIAGAMEGPTMERMQMP